MKKQILSAVLISTMLAATLAGCGSKAADPTTAAPAAQTETLDIAHQTHFDDHRCAGGHLTGLVMAGSRRWCCFPV